ncbi:IS3 family transposase [Sporosarcina sp. FA9]|uniref:IS3 family transposase n=1 Tax=Sporosarcina sp. FA9 TaxID=3413030 RepID=UPI003F65DDF7
MKIGIIPSMSRKANCWNNAVIEGFFSHLKTEFSYLLPIHLSEQMREDLPKFIQYLNGERSQKRLGYLTRISFMNTQLEAI